MKLYKALKKYKRVRSLSLSMDNQKKESILYWLLKDDISYENRCARLKEFQESDDWEEDNYTVINND